MRKETQELASLLLLKQEKVADFQMEDGYPLVMTNIAIENDHAIHGKIHYFDWAIFNSYVSHYQRVNPIKIPLNPIKPSFSYGFPMVKQSIIQHPIDRVTNGHSPGKFPSPVCLHP